MRQQMNLRKQHTSNAKVYGWNMPIYSCPKSDVLAADLYVFIGTLEQADSIGGRLYGS